MSQKGPIHYIEVNTFKHNKELKALGCRWDPDKKAWCTMDPYTASKARVLVDERLRKLLAKASKRRRP